METQRIRKGFTLVEVVVLAIIVAVLAAVAVPTYTGYVQRARQDAVDNLANSVASAADIYVRRKGTGGLTLGALSVVFDSTKHSVNLDVGTSTVTVTDQDDNTIQGVATC